MKYSCVVVAVRDIAASKRFYEELFGLEVYQDYGINVSFTCGLALQQEFGWLVGVEKEHMCWQPRNMELCFEEEDLDTFLKKLAQHPEIEMCGPVHTHSWGQRVVRFYDPNGHIIEVGESIKMVVQRFLSSGFSKEEVGKKMDVSPSDLEKILQE